MVATYWSVLVTVRMAHTEITETGISSDARTTSTQALTRLTRWRGACLPLSPVAAIAPLGSSSGSTSFIWARSYTNA